VALDRLELADRNGRERRVLGVGGEDPRVVRIARADPAGVRHGAGRRRVRRLGLALVDEADLQVVRPLGEVGDVLLAPVDALLEPTVSGQRQLAVVRQALARVDLAGERAGRVGERSVELRARRRRALVRAGDAHPQRLGAVCRDAHVVGELAAGPLAERALVAEELALGRETRLSALVPG
jgi:hypothetical protein